MTSHTTELVAVILERNGKDEMRFLPTCAGCGELILDPTTANVAVVTGTGSGKLTKTNARHLGARVSRIDGRASVFWWPCDEQQGNNIPWGNAALTFRDCNDSAQQRLEPSFRSVSTRRAGYAR
jgi:hypothetical protein